MDDYLKEFVQESEDHITELNNALLDLESDPNDEGAMDSIFRTAHTIKGNCGAMGFTKAADLAHAIEDLLDEMRAGRVAVSPETMDEVFEGVDTLEQMVEETREEGEPQTDPREVIDDLRGVIEDAPGPDVRIEPPSETEIETTLQAVEGPAEPEQQVYHVRLAVDEADAEDEGMLVLEALADAFDVLATNPPQNVIRAEDYGKSFDAIVSSAIGDDDITAALEAVDQVDEVLVTDVTEHVGVDRGEGEVDVDDMEVEELLESVSEFDDIDQRAEEMAEEEAMEELGEAGTFEEVDLDADDDIEIEGLLEEEELAEDDEIEESDLGEMEDLEPDDDPDDANAVFKELQEEVDEVDYEELEPELEALEFDEFSDDEEMGFDELVGEVEDTGEEDLEAFDSEFDESDDGLDEVDELFEEAEPEIEADPDAEEMDVDELIETAGEETAEVAADLDVDMSDLSEGEASSAGDTDAGADDGTDAEPAGTDTAGADAGADADAAAEPDADVAADEALDDLDDFGSEFDGEIDEGAVDDVAVDDLVDEAADIDDMEAADIDDVGAADIDDVEPTDVEGAGAADVEDVGGVDDVGEVEVDDVAAADDEFDLEIEPEEGEPVETEPSGDELAEIESIRVDVSQVDSLLNQVEELVTSRIRLRRAIEEGDLSAAESGLDELETLTMRMQDTVMDIRLVPLEQVVGRLPRVVRDIARDQDKEVDFAVEGADVEVDRRILSELGDPLMHLVRNAVDHGIEAPDVREENGKPREGRIRVRARRARDNVVIEIVDDGSGLDTEAIAEKAVAEGIRTPEEVGEMAESEIHELIFEPGFTTVDEVTDVSGRGVGMDVVRATVQNLDGSVGIDSAEGQGTTIRLEVPVSVAIVRVLFIESGGEEYGVPVNSVDEITRMGATETVDGESVLTHDDRVYPVVELGEALETPGPHANGDGMLLRVNDDVRQVALHCDSVSRQEEVVIKPYEGLLSGIPGLSGAAVLGEGNVVNILDVETL